MIIWIICQLIIAVFLFSKFQLLLNSQRFKAVKLNCKRHILAWVITVQLKFQTSALWAAIVRPILLALLSKIVVAMIMIKMMIVMMMILLILALSLYSLWKKPYTNYLELWLLSRHKVSLILDSKWWWSKWDQELTQMNKWIILLMHWWQPLFPHKMILTLLRKTCTRLSWHEQGSI